MDFSIKCSNELWILFLAYHLVPHFILEKNMKKLSDLTLDSKEGVSYATGELGCTFLEINKAVHLILEGQSDFQQIPREL